MPGTLILAAAVMDFKVLKVISIYYFPVTKKLACFVFLVWALTHSF